jgi:hypothetical protein
MAATFPLFFLQLPILFNLSFFLARSVTGNRQDVLSHPFPRLLRPPGFLRFCFATLLVVSCNVLLPRLHALSPCCNLLFSFFINSKGLRNYSFKCVRVDICYILLYGKTYRQLMPKNQNSINTYPCTKKTQYLSISHTYT